MADEAVVHIGENSPEQVAFKLLLSVAVAEGKGFKVVAGVPCVTGDGDRKWLLDTYAECVQAVKNPLGRLSKRAD